MTVTLNANDALSACEGVIRHLLAPNGLQRDLDAYQEGVLGCMEAVSSYRAEMGVKFTTYAYTFIKGRICEYAHRRDLGGIKAESDSVRYSADETTAIKRMLRWGKPMTDEGEEDREWTDAVCVRRFQATDSYAALQDRIACREALAAFEATLDADDRVVWEAYMRGNLSELARDLGVSRQTVSQRWRRIQCECAEFIGDPRRFRMYETWIEEAAR